MTSEPFPPISALPSIASLVVGADPSTSPRHPRQHTLPSLRHASSLAELPPHPSSLLSSSFSRPGFKTASSVPLDSASLSPFAPKPIDLLNPFSTHDLRHSSTLPSLLSDDPAAPSSSDYKDDLHELRRGTVNCACGVRVSHGEMLKCGGCGGASHLACLSTSAKLLNPFLCQSCAHVSIDAGGSSIVAETTLFAGTLRRSSYLSSTRPSISRESTGTRPPPLTGYQAQAPVPLLRASTSNSTPAASSSSATTTGAHATATSGNRSSSPSSSNSETSTLGGYLPGQEYGTGRGGLPVEARIFETSDDFFRYALAKFESIPGGGRPEKKNGNGYRYLWCRNRRNADSCRYETSVQVVTVGQKTRFRLFSTMEVHNESCLASIGQVKKKKSTSSTGPRRSTAGRAAAASASDRRSHARRQRNAAPVDALLPRLAISPLSESVRSVPPNSTPLPPMQPRAFHLPPIDGAASEYTVYNASRASPSLASPGLASALSSSAPVYPNFPASPPTLSHSESHLGSTVDAMNQLSSSPIDFMSPHLAKYRDSDRHLAGGFGRGRRPSLVSSSSIGNLSDHSMGERRRGSLSGAQEERRYLGWSAETQSFLP